MTKYKNVTNWNEVPVLVDEAYVCNLFRVHRATLHNWDKKDILKRRRIGGAIRYAKEDLIKFAMGE